MTDGILDKYATLPVPGPVPTGESAQFWEGLRSNRYLLLRCGRCAAFQPYPVRACRSCWGLELDWVQASGRATVVSWTAVHKPGHPAWAELAPYVIGLVRLSEGVTVLTQLLCGAHELRVGRTCSVEYVDVGGWTLPFFALDNDDSRGES